MSDRVVVVTNRLNGAVMKAFNEWDDAVEWKEEGPYPQGALRVQSAKVY